MEMNTDEIREWIIRHTEEYCQEVAGLVRFPSVSQKTSDQDKPFGKACAIFWIMHLVRGRTGGSRHIIINICAGLCYGEERIRRKSAYSGIWM